MINQLFRTLERRTDKGMGGESVKPIFVMLDEATRLGKIENIKNAASFDSRNLKR
jgi:type IV secretory pathway TraG/TraD family ATPase VirD4